MKNSINGVLFDLDDTLWDFHANAQTALEYIWRMIQHKGHLAESQHDIFMNVYQKHNTKLWTEYREGRRDAASIRTTRFILSAADVGVSVDHRMAEELAQAFLAHLYEGKILIAGAREILNYLKANYKIGLITNGFSQGLCRLKTCQLEPFFDFVLCSEDYGHPKPHPGIFQHAVTSLGLKPHHCIYVGDNYDGDIIGAKKAGLKAIYFNLHHKNVDDNVIKPDAIITNLAQLKTLL